MYNFAYAKKESEQIVQLCFKIVMRRVSSWNSKSRTVSSNEKESRQFPAEHGSMVENR